MGYSDGKHITFALVIRRRYSDITATVSQIVDTYDKDVCLAGPIDRAGSPCYDLSSNALHCFCRKKYQSGSG
jgi:hypothetical protein